MNTFFLLYHFLLSFYCGSLFSLLLEYIFPMTPNFRLLVLSQHLLSEVSVEAPEVPEVGDNGGAEVVLERRYPVEPAVEG